MMPSRMIAIAALGTALLLAACAQKPQPAPAAAAAPAAPMVEPGVMPSAAAKPIMLGTDVLPEGGQLEQGTLVTGKNGWAAHGESDGVAWRFGSMDGGFLRVAGVPGTEWQHIQVAQSWGVQCKVEATGTTPCIILRIQPVQAGSMISGGLALDEHTTCVRADDPMQDATVSVDGGAPVNLPAGLCIGGPASDALQQQMLSGKSVAVTAHFTPKGPQQSIAVPTDGLKQALAMRAWILEQYQAGKLHAM
ncbi:MAG TPA: hypothetical protein VMQ73_01845 [Methylomirabilota bacterium]|nr:hypothetical protein [Methylomirabilota bacterium]